MTNLIRVGLVDDHVLFREGLRDLLNASQSIEVVGESGDGYEGLTLASEKKPDIMIMDLRLPKMGGIPTIRKIHQLHPNIKIMVVSMFDDIEHRNKALAAGADAYFSKMTESAQIIQAIIDLKNGKEFISANERIRIQLSITDQDVEEANLPDIQYRILEALAGGRSNKEIADSLFMSESTLKKHLTNLYRFLGAKTRTDALRRAVDKQIISMTV